MYPEAKLEAEQENSNPLERQVAKLPQLLNRPLTADLKTVLKIASVAAHRSWAGPNQVS